MKTCPVCTGRCKTARLQERWRGQKLLHIDVLGIDLHLIGQLVDQPCKTCCSSGQVTEEMFCVLTRPPIRLAK